MNVGPTALIVHRAQIVTLIIYLFNLNLVPLCSTVVPKECLLFGAGGGGGGELGELCELLEVVFMVVELLVEEGDVKEVELESETAGGKPTNETG